MILKSRFPWHALAALICLLAAATPQAQQQPISEAEQRLFMDYHLKNVAEASALHYRFSKSGSLEEAFDDEASVEVKKSKSGNGRQCKVSYLSGTNAFKVPDIAEATGNPVILSFLERDIREMQRITKGQANYFRKRVRMALAEAADVKPVTFKFKGTDVRGVEIKLAPFADDPMRARFEKFSNKTYVFTLSDQVPGAVYRLHSVMSDTAQSAGNAKAAPLIEEVLTLDEPEK
jgi:hypothetical protein